MEKKEQNIFFGNPEHVNSVLLEGSWVLPGKTVDLDETDCGWIICTLPLMLDSIQSKCFLSMFQHVFLTFIFSVFGTYTFGMMIGIRGQL